ncbi:hypothetical protein Tco_0400076 [Tanacetum coccineum]
MQEVILFYNRLRIPTRQILDAKVAIQEMAEYSQKWHNGTSRQMSKVLHERGFGSLPSSTEANPRDQVKSISTTIEDNSCPIRRIGSAQYVVSTGQNHTLMYETRQMTIPFPSRLNSYYCEEKKGSCRP